MDVIMRIDLSMWSDGLGDHVREKMRTDLARALYDAGEHPAGDEVWAEELGKVVMVDGQPTHVRCEPGEADHVEVTLSRPSQPNL
jgi:hypothetical protein